MFHSLHKAPIFLANAVSTGSCLKAGAVALAVGDEEGVVAMADEVGAGCAGGAVPPLLAEHPPTPSRRAVAPIAAHCTARCPAKSREVTVSPLRYSPGEIHDTRRFPPCPDFQE